MQSALEIAERQARAHGAVRIQEIRMRVGRLTGVVPEALEQAFTVLREGTLAAGARLAVEYVAAVCRCAACAKEFESEGLLSECPDCGTPSADVTSGTEMEIVSLEVD